MNLIRLNSTASAGALAALLAACPALAAPLEAPSRIANVVVYPDSARVARIVEVELPAGATSLVLRGLPMALDPASLRVEGEASAGLSIGSAQSRVAPADAQALPESAARQLRDLRARAGSIETRIGALEGRRAMVKAFADAGPDKLGPFGGGLDIAKWGEAFDAVGRELAKVGEDIRVANLELAEVREQIRALEASNRGPAGAQPARDVVVDLEAAAPARAKITVTYQVRGAYWRPAYDVRLATDKGAKAQMEFVRRALVRQRTGEDWTNAEIAVSTTRPGRGAQAPEVFTERMAFFEPRPMARAQAPAPMSADMETARRSGVAASLAPAPMRAAAEQEAVLDAGDYEAVFRIPGRIDVPGDGSERSLRIGSRQVPADLSVRAAPALDPTAYLEAAFVNAEEAPILPGDLSIQRNGVFVGRSQLPMVAPGASTRIGLGADERVKVERKPVSRKENEPSWFGSNKQETREFRTTVQNLHPFPIRAFIVDRIPISENSAITIEQLPATTPPNDKTVEGRRGVLGWTFDIAPNETKEIRLAYRMRWPADREVVFETLPDNGERPIPLPRPMR